MAESKRTDLLYFTLGPRRAMWRSNDGSIVLSSLPNDKGETKPFGYVARGDSINVGQVMNAMRSGQLMKLAGPPTSMVSKGKINNLSEKRDEDVKTDSEAKTLLRLKTEVFENTLKSITSPKLIRAAILLESKGVNKSNKKRDNILQLLKDRLEALGGFTEYSEIDATLTATYNPETQEGLGKVV